MRFDAELRLIGDEVPEEQSSATIAQAVQASIGYSGVKVLDVTKYEEIGDGR